MIKYQRIPKSGLAIVLLALLTGCESRTDQATVKMQEIRNQPPLPIEPPPEFTPVPNYNYAGYQIKSPFIPTSLDTELKVMAGKRVYPNLSRPLQPLESYALEVLIMKGTMRSSAGKIIALIRTPEGELERVENGSYMGQNHGRIVKITPNQIDLLEIVPDGQDGYIERPRTLILHSGTV